MLDLVVCDVKSTAKMESSPSASEPGGQFCWERRRMKPSVPWSVEARRSLFHYGAETASGVTTMALMPSELA